MEALAPYVIWDRSAANRGEQGHHAAASAGSPEEIIELWRVEAGVARCVRRAGPAIGSAQGTVPNESSTSISSIRVTVCHFVRGVRCLSGWRAAVSITGRRGYRFDSQPRRAGKPMHIQQLLAGESGRRLAWGTADNCL